MAIPKGKEKANALRIFAEKSMSSKKLGGGGAINIGAASGKPNIDGTSKPVADRPEGDNSNADMPQAVHKPGSDSD